MKFDPAVIMDPAGLVMIILPGMFANAGQRYSETGWRSAVKALIALGWARR